MISRFAIQLLLVMVLGAVGRLEASDMNAWVDRTQIGEGETVQLTLEVQGQVRGRPDTTPLGQDFEILGISTGSRVNIVNGRTDTRTSWVLTLTPRRSGTLTIPSLQVGNHRSEPLVLEVSDALAPSSGSGADIFIESEIEPGTSYVQGQVLYTIRLLHAVPISRGRLSEPASGNILVQRLGTDREYDTVRNGRRYQVIERRYAIFPQTSGPLELDAPVFSGEIPDNSRKRSRPFSRFLGNDPFFGTDPFEDMLTPTHRVRVRGELLSMDVMPRPETAQGMHWLPAEQLELKGSWQPDSGDVLLGEPVTLMLELEARGLTGAQLPDLVPEKVDGFRIYPDQAQHTTETGETGVTGHLQQKVAFIPERSGELQLPAIEVRWWDTQAKQERVAILPGRIMEVSQAAGQSAQVAADDISLGTAIDEAASQDLTVTSIPDSAQAASLSPIEAVSGPWPWISAALATGWLLTLVIWWWRVRGPQVDGSEATPNTTKSQSAAATRKRFLAACKANDATSAHQSLLAWAAIHWRHDPPRGLDALAKRLPEKEAREALAELNRALYMEGGQWKGERLAKCLHRLPRLDAITSKNTAVIPPLYQ